MQPIEQRDGLLSGGVQMRTEVTMRPHPEMVALVEKASTNIGIGLAVGLIVAAIAYRIFGPKQ